jgi:hypothetical protein
LKIIFLDIDGCLAPIPRPFKQEYFKESCVKALEFVCQEVDVKIVISSTWRIGQTIKELRKTMSKLGFHYSELVIGKTIDYTETGEFLYLTRGQEISTWLMNQPSVESYCIIDDDTDISPHGPRWVQPKHELGLQEHDAESCVRILKNGLTKRE